MRRIARAIIIHRQKILLIKREKYSDEFYVLPGGGIDQGETAEEAAEREVMEETSIESHIGRMVYEERTPEFGVTYYFSGEYIRGEPELMADSVEAHDSRGGHNSYEPQWVDLADLEDIHILPSVIEEQLLYDLEFGFSQEIRIIEGQKESL